MSKDFFKKAIGYVLRLESELVLRKYKPKIVAITGSVGKTSTKDAVFAVISGFAYVRKSEKSYNSEIGLPLTILGLPNGWNNPLIWFKNILKGLWLVIWPHEYPKWLVLEVGVGKPGDMRRTASWLRTDAVIMTAIAETPVHIEFFESRRHLIEEKSQLIRTLRPGGLLVLNADDEAIIAMKQKSKNRTITYGFAEGADILASGESILYLEDGPDAGAPAGVAYRIDYGGASQPVEIAGVFGRNHVYASLASLALSAGLGWNMIQAAASLKKYDAPPGRMRLLRGIKDTFIIDDSYNSSPFASEAALDTLGSIRMPKLSARKIAVLGDMLELGRHTQNAHEDIGRRAGRYADALFTVGPRSVSIREGALAAGMRPDRIYEFSDSQSAGAFLKDFIGGGDVILIKGSQGMRMERAAEALLADIANKRGLLVRQEPEWLSKE